MKYRTSAAFHVAIEQHVAEKLHAYTRTYAADRPSSRVKDLVDIVVISHTTTIDADRLRRAIRDIFQRRGSIPCPAPCHLRPAIGDRVGAGSSRTSRPMKMSAVGTRRPHRSLTLFSRTN